MTPQRISYRKIERQIQDVDQSVFRFEVVWDDREEGLRIYTVHIPGTTPTPTPPYTHFFWEQKTNAWFTDQIQGAANQPTYASVRDGDDPLDRAILVGTNSGDIWRTDESAKSDALDGAAPNDPVDIECRVVMGP
jgi:hypothetical protein